jgi:hypothetical protein
MRHNRRTCAKLCHDSGGELEQIQFLLGHASVQTTGCKQNLGNPVNDRFKLRVEFEQQESNLESAVVERSRVGRNRVSRRHRMQLRRIAT